MEVLEEHHGKYFPTGFIILGWFLSAIGVVLLLNLKPWCLPFLLAGPLTLFSTVGIQINFTTKQYRDYTSIFGIKLGTWHKIPELDYITVFKAHFSQTVNVGLAMSADTESEKYTVTMVASVRERILVGDYDHKDKAISRAAYVSNRLQVKVLDSTEREQHWLGIM